MITGTLSHTAIGCEKRIFLWMDWLRHHLIAVIGTAAVFALGALVTAVGQKIINAKVRAPREHYRDRKLLSTIVVVLGAFIIAILWARLIPHHGTFFGLVAAGLAIALREPLLSVAGRIAIFGGRIYEVGDRVQIGSASGDVIDIGFIYTRLMEIGNWIGGDQYSGRILQFPNAQIFGTGVFNYTRDFQYIWDEIHLPITYESNLNASIEILVEAATEYTKKFLEGAQQQLARMQEYFLVPDFELRPQVYLKVTTNWVGLTMRYVVDPQKRRAASTFLYRSVFEQIRRRDDIKLGTDTMEVAYKRANEESQLPSKDRAA